MISDILSRSCGRFSTSLFTRSRKRCSWQAPSSAAGRRDVLFGKAVPVVTANHRIGQVEIFDHRLQFPLVLFGYSTSEDGGDLLGWPDVSIQVQQPLGEFLHRCPPMED